MVLNEAQYSSIESAGKLSHMGSATKVPLRSGKLVYDLTLPRQGVSLLEVELSRASCFR
jgi:hypothetical protein